MRMRLILCLLLIPGALHAQTATFEVFDDAAFTQRSGTMDAGFKTLYVRVVPFVLAPPGYTGFEFRLTGLDDFLMSAMDWSTQPNVLLGNLADGMNVAWPNCQYNELLLSFTVYSLNPPQNREIRVAAHTNPSNPNFTLPFLTSCDVPCIFCGNPLDGEAYILNPSVAVEGANWSHIKRLYR